MKDFKGAGVLFACCVLCSAALAAGAPTLTKALLRASKPADSAYIEQGETPLSSGGKSSAANFAWVAALLPAAAAAPLLARRRPAAKTK